MPTCKVIFWKPPMLSEIASIKRAVAFTETRPSESVNSLVPLMEIRAPSTALPLSKTTNSNADNCVNEEPTGMVKDESMLPPSISISQLGCNSKACLNNNEIVKVVELQDQLTGDSTTNWLFSKEVNLAREFISMLGALMTALSPIICDWSNNKTWEPDEISMDEETTFKLLSPSSLRSPEIKCDSPSGRGPRITD